VDQVLAVQWSPDGKHLAAAGGSPGSFGEVCVWDVPASGAWDKPRVLRDHADAIYGLAWRPGAEELATGSLDKTAKIWDVTAGKVKRTLKDHVDAVMSVAYSADGKWLATGSMDRTVKLYDTVTDTKQTNLNHGDGVTAIAFGPKSDILVAACVNKEVKVWPVRAGVVENPLRGHGEGEPVNAVAFSADGSIFVWGASNRRVRVWNGDVGGQRREMADCPDWIYAVSASPDGKTVAAGGGDGKVYFWNAADGKLLRSVPMGAPAAVASAGVKK
jgi:WD40 repeat protein